MSSPEPHDPLDRLLTEWQIRPAANPAFRPAVWARLRASSGETWATYVRAHLGVWSAAMLVTITVAGWAGVTSARTRLEAQREALAVAYLVELDPRVQAQLRQSP